MMAYSFPFRCGMARDSKHICSGMYVDILGVFSGVVEIPPHNTPEIDHIIRRALALQRMCFKDVPNSYQLLNEKLQERFGEDWKKHYQFRNNEELKE
ncbi:unnamed protein product [Clavelina lepadiformis]|uniref:Uncharacterized protein n=1 Tax=Clavelina lepadiformis TaxID=159417 RepID=A0ABP0FC98_CLALP